MNENESLREQMWDLCYGLLSAEEVAALHKQVKSDPAAARLYAEVRLQADLVASAAKIEDASVTLSVPDEGRKVQSASKSHSAIGESPFKSGNPGRPAKKTLPSYRAANWLAGIAASALVALVGYGLLAGSSVWNRHESALDARIVAYVYGSDSLQSGLSENLKVVTKNRLGEPASTLVAYHVFYQNGEPAYSANVRTDASGETQIALPGQFVQKGARVEVQPLAEDLIARGANDARMSDENEKLAQASPRFAIPLTPREEPITADVRVEKDWYQPGDTIRFWAHSWGTFSHKPAAAEGAWKLTMADGQEIAPLALDSQSEAGVVTGEFQLPPDAPTGNYRLHVDANDGHSPVASDVLVAKSEADVRLLAANQMPLREDQKVADGRNRTVTKSLAMRSMSGTDTYKADKDKAKEFYESRTKSPLPPGNKDLAQGKAFKFAEGGLPGAAGGASAPPTRRTAPPVPALPERFAKGGGGSEPRPTAPPESLAGNSAAPGLHSEAAESSKESFFKKADRDAENEAMAELTTAALGVFESRADGVQVQLPTDLLGKKLIVAVQKSGVQVAAQAFDSLALAEQPSDRKALDESGAVTAETMTVPSNSLEPAPEGVSAASKERNVSELSRQGGARILPLPPEADGDVDVLLYDESGDQPRLVHRETLHRWSKRELNLDVVQDLETAAPGQTAKFNIRVTDQQGREVPKAWLAAQMVKTDSAASSSMFSYLARDKRLEDKRLEEKLDLQNGSRAMTRERGKPDELKPADLNKNRGEDNAGALEPEIKEKDAKKTAATGKSNEPSPQTLAGPAGGAPAATPAPSPQDALRVEGPAEDLHRSGPFDDLRAQAIPAPRITREVLLGSNDIIVQQAEEADRQAASLARVNFQRMVGKAILLVAAAALLMFGLLAMLHRQAQARVWLPAMVVVAGSFIVGCLWLLNGKMSRRDVAWKTPDVAESRPTAPAPKAAAPDFREDAAEPPLPAASDFSPHLDQTLGANFGGGIGRTAEAPPVAPPGEAPSELAADKSPPAAGGFGGGMGGKPLMKKQKGQELAGEEPQTAPREPAAEAPAPAETEKAKKELKKEGEAKDASTQDGTPSKASGDSKTPAGRPNGGEKKGMERREPFGDVARDPQSLEATPRRNVEMDRKQQTARFLWSNLPANEKGEAGLELQMPMEAGDYVLIVDVQGPAGVGRIQRRISVRDPASPAAPASPAQPTTPAKP